MYNSHDKKAKRESIFLGFLLLDFYLVYAAGQVQKYITDLNDLMGL